MYVSPKACDHADFILRCSYSYHQWKARNILRTLWSSLLQSERRRLLKMEVCATSCCTNRSGAGDFLSAPSAPVSVYSKGFLSYVRLVLPTFTRLRRIYQKALIIRVCSACLAEEIEGSTSSPLQRFEKMTGKLCMLSAEQRKQHDPVYVDFRPSTFNKTEHVCSTSSMKS